jgi:hypothetical protein
MADNVQLPVTGTGTADIVAATDDVASVHYPFVKLADGTLGQTTPIAAGHGTAAAALRVELPTDGTGQVTIIGAGGLAPDFQAENDNWNAADRGMLIFGRDQDSSPNKYRAFNLDVDGSAKVVGAAAAGAAVSGNPVLIAGQDGTDVRSLKTDASGELQVDVLTLPAVTVSSAPTTAVTAAAASQADGHSVNIGALADADTASTLTGLLKKVKALLNGGLPAALGAQGALRVEGVASGTSIPVDLSAAIPAGTNAIGTVQPGNTANTTPWLVTQTPATAGGLTTFHLVGAASTNATVVKNSAGQLYGYYIFNANAAMRKVAFHNTASTPTAGASVFFTLCIPGASGANVALPSGIAFSSGIAITTVTGFADSDATAIASTDLNINLFYK